MPGVYKIGSTSRDLQIRVRELSSASGVPVPFRVALEYQCDDHGNVEFIAHDKLAGMRVHPKREFFRADLETIDLAICDILGEQPSFAGPLLPVPVDPGTSAEITRLLALKAAIDHERAARRVAAARGSLAEFLKLGWHVLEPSTKLDWGWHIEALCSHVQAMLEAQWHAKDTGEELKVQNLAINVPPGTLKSRILSVYAPAWAWLHRPAWRLLALSSNPVVADRDADLSKQLITSEWYTGTFDIRWSLRKDRDAIRNFANTEGGYRISRGLNATVTGLRGDTIIIDDPNDVKDVSDVKLEAVERNWKAAANRVSDERTAVRILIQQRTHERDLTGVIFDKGSAHSEGADWSHLVIPMEREGSEVECIACRVVHRKSFMGWVDQRSEGEVLQPERNTPKVISAMKRRLGTFGYAGQAQQRPSPLGGGMFKQKWWRYYDSLEQTTHKQSYDKLDQQVISVDANFKEGGTSRAAILVVGGLGPKRFIMDLWAESVDYPTLKAQLKLMIGKYPRYSKIIIEDKANGSALIAELQSTHQRVIAVQPQGGKVARASAVLPVIEAGDVSMPRHAAWKDEFVEEHSSFPRGRYDDLVDALTQALTEMQGLACTLSAWA